MEYDYPTLLVDQTLKRLHVSPPASKLKELRKKCDIGDNNTFSFSFMEAVRLINEEGYRPCGTCLEEGGETSNWKERAERAESQLESANAKIARLEVQLSPPEKAPSDG